MSDRGCANMPMTAVARRPQCLVLFSQFQSYDRIRHRPTMAWAQYFGLQIQRPPARTSCVAFRLLSKSSRAASGYIVARATSHEVVLAA
eukprot:6194963-Pleurochrysis_carterae.AAC.2